MVGIPVSVIVMTRNEAANIAACLSGLAPFDQVLVVDSDSADGTAALAARLGAETVSFRWNGRYPKKKQWSLQWPGLRHDWVLFVDADEVVSPALAAEIGDLMRQSRPEGAFFLSSRQVWLGRELRHGCPYRKIALLHRHRARFLPCDDLDVAAMWEVEGHYQPVVDGPVGHLRQKLRHDDHKSPFAWIERHNRYSDWEAQLAGRASGALLAGERGWRRWAKQMVRRLPGRPLLAFLHAYVLHLGFLDGWAGWHHACGRAFYYWQIGLKREWLATREGASHSTRATMANPIAAALPLADQASFCVSELSPASAFTSSKVRRRTVSSGIR